MRRYKSYSFISLSKNKGDPANRRCDLGDMDKDDTRTGDMGHSKGGITILIEVLRCEFGRPGRPTTDQDNGLVPAKGWTPLYYAVYHNRDAALLRFLRAGQSPDGVAEIGQPPLCIAVVAGHLNIVKILLEARANINAATKHDCETALHLAIKKGQTDFVDVLLAHGPDLNARTLSTSETPLHYAATKPGSLATVVSLLKQGADYEALNAKGISPAEAALQQQNLNAAVAIIGAARGKQKKLSKEKELLLKHVEKAQNRFSMNNELIADIFEAGCPPDSTVLVEAIKRDDVGLVEMFLEKGADPNRATAGTYPIFTALNCASAKVVHALAKHGADVTLLDPHGLTVPQVALECPTAHDKEAITGLFQIFLSNGADPLTRYSDGTTLLHRAVAPGFGLARVAQQLLQHGVKVNEPDNIGNTALHVATHSRSCIAVLLKHGADVNLINHEGVTPLLHATRTATRQQEPDLEQLVKLSGPRATDLTGKTALHLAAENGLEKTVRLFLQASADTTWTDAQERTPLHLAVLNQQWHIVPLLAIQPGINSWDEDGMTALHHIAMSIPESPDSWKEIATATVPFCGKGVSRIMRDRSGATPLIQAVKTLPEEGVPVVETLLSQKASRGTNCVGHEDHKGFDALYYAATLEKPIFVEVLLKHGAPFVLKAWKPSKGPVKLDTDNNKRTLKLLAEHEWLRRVTKLHRQSIGTPSDPILPEILPLSDLKVLLAMGLDPNALSQAKSASPLLWVVLNQAGLPQPLPPAYLQDVLKLLFSSGADPNAITTRSLRRTSPGRNSPQPMLTLHPLAFLLEQCSDVHIDLVSMFLDNGVNLSTASTFYDGRYPLHSAVQANRTDVVDRFLTQKADVNCIDAKGRAPMFIAAEKGNLEIFNLLLRSGAKSDMRDNEGNTLLHAAVVGGISKIVSSLLRVGVKASEANHKGLLPSSCIGEGIEDKEREKLAALLKYTEEQERREALLREQHLQRLAIQEEEARIRKAKEEERVRKAKEEERARKAKEAKQRSSKTPPMASRVTSSTTSATERSTTSPFHVSKNMLSIQYTSPSQINKQANATKQNPTHNDDKALSQPRADSGLDLNQQAESDKPLPLLTRNKATFDDKEETEGGVELSDWLTMSNLLDRL
jgi:ankyrin repeat protein